MAYEFRARSMIDDAGTKVFSLAYDKAEQRSPVRLEVSNDHIRNVWGLSLQDADAVKDRMDAEKVAYLERCEAAGLEDYNAIGVVQVG